MTTEDRLAKAEHILAGHVEQARKDQEENRRLWRDHQTSIDAIWKRMEQRDLEYREETKRLGQEFRDEMKRRDDEYRRDMKDRDEKIDKRIGDLVSAIGELC